VYITELLDTCHRLEAQVGRIYRSFASRFEQNKPVARLWRELALEEETHADILARERRTFEEQDDSDPFLPDFDERVAQIRAQLGAIEHRALSCSIEDAFAIASDLERCGLEELYDDLLLQSDPAFKLLSERLEAALSNLPEHQERIQRAAQAHRREPRRS